MKRALIIVDMQFDFLSGGALAVPDGDAVIPIIMEMVKEGHYDRVIATRDAHPRVTDHFKVWPPHCILGTAGAGIHPFMRELCSAVISKGQGRKDNGYSGFEGRTTLSRRTLDEMLRTIDEVTIVGLALDYCVKATALDAVKHGYETIVPLSATRAVQNETEDQAIYEMGKAGVKVTV